MSKLPIKGGTPVGSAPLCRTCSNAHILSGYRESEMLVVCTATYPDFPVPFVVRECCGYNDRNRPDWDQMSKLAIHVTPRLKSSTRFGFGDPDSTLDGSESSDGESDSD